MKNEPDAGLKVLRARIDGLDRKLTGMLAARMALAGRLGRLKKNVRDEKREALVLANVARECRRNGWDYGFAEPVFEELMRQSVKMQRALRGEPREVTAFLVGGDTGNSLSPFIHELLGRRARVPVRYFRVQLAEAELPAFLDFCAFLGITGLNVTLPLKRAAARLSRPDRIARLVGAVNVLQAGPAGWLGFNTDADGLALCLAERGISFGGADVALLGAGGAARAGAFAAARGGAKSVTFFNRTLAHAGEAARHFRRIFPAVRFAARGADKFADAKAHLFIKSAPDTAYRAGSFNRNGEGFAVDMGYGPALSPFLRDAGRAGYGIIRGHDMLIYQAILSFEIWSGAKFPDLELEKDLIARTLAARGLLPGTGEKLC